MRNAKNALKKAENTLVTLQDNERKIKAEIKKLERLGAVAGTIHWQEKRPGYMVAYFNHVTDGKRHRDYIGIDKRKIKAIENKIKRAERVRFLKFELSNTERALDTYTCLLNSACSQSIAVSKGQRMMW